MKNSSSDSSAYVAPESICKDHLDFWGLEMVLFDKYAFEVVFKSFAGPRKRIQEEYAENSLWWTYFDSREFPKIIITLSWISPFLMNSWNN